MGKLTRKGSLKSFPEANAREPGFFTGKPNHERNSLRHQQTSLCQGAWP